MLLNASVVLPQLQGRPGDVVTATAQHHKTVLDCMSLGQEKIEIQPLEYGSCWTRITFIPWLSCEIINQNSAKSGTISVLYRSGITYITQQLDLFKQYIITLETPFQVITCKSKLLFLKHAKCLAMSVNHAFVNQHPMMDFQVILIFLVTLSDFAINGLLHTLLWTGISFTQDSFSKVAAF